MSMLESWKKLCEILDLVLVFNRPAKSGWSYEKEIVLNMIDMNNFQCLPLPMPVVIFNTNLKYYASY